MQQCRCLQGPSPLLSGASGASGAPGAQNCQALFPGRIPVPGLSWPCFEQAPSSLRFWFYLLFDDPKIA